MAKIMDTSVTQAEDETATETEAATADAAASTPLVNGGYSWQSGDCLANYSNTAKKWKEHTSTPEFATAFLEIIDDQTLSNDERDTKIDTFLLAEANIAEVVSISKARRMFTNPNRWDKHMAPWYNTKCRESKRTFRNMRKQYGKKHSRTLKALYKYVQTCKDSRAYL